MPYATTTELNNYAASRGITLSGDLDVLLTKAHDFIDSHSFIGIKTEKTQVNQWPRTGAAVGGYALEDNEIPTDIINAEFQAAILIASGVDLMATVAPQVKKTKLDVMETEYQANANSEPYYKSVMRFLNPYLAAAGNKFKVAR
jgi:hypothetical protein